MTATATTPAHREGLVNTLQQSNPITIPVVALSLASRAR